MRWLVDGYNVIRRAPELKSREQESLDAGRQAYVIAAGGTGGEGVKIAVVGSGISGLGAGILTDHVRVEWNERMRTTVGRADFRRCLISLNPALQEFGPAEIDRTLRHELAHLLAHFRFGRRRIQSHGREWRDACCQLGISGERAGHTLPLIGRSLSRRFIYYCQNCQGHFPRVRHIRRATACLACCRKFSEGNYDERFRLRLVKIFSSGDSPRF